MACRVPGSAPSGYDGRVSGTSKTAEHAVLKRRGAAAVVIAAFLVLVTPLCRDGVVTGMPMSPAAANGVSVGVVAMECPSVPPGPASHPDALMLCAAFLVAIMVSSVAMPPRTARQRGGRRPIVVRWLTAGPSRRPALAQLCVLRT